MKTPDYLVELEKVKAQYKEYLEVSGLLELPIFQADPEPQYMPPSMENPLTSNKIYKAGRGKWQNPFNYK